MKFPNSQYQLGVIYLKGEGGIPQNFEEAFRFFSLSVKHRKGYAKAHYQLGQMYSSGKGVAQSYERACHYYSLAANKGFADAQHYLAFMYEIGLGIAKNLEEARRLYQLAADQGHEKSQIRLNSL